jgi:hypothetical protein
LQHTVKNLHIRMLHQYIIKFQGRIWIWHWDNHFPLAGHHLVTSVRGRRDVDSPQRGKLIGNG